MDLYAALLLAALAVLFIRLTVDLARLIDYLGKGR